MSGRWGMTPGVEGTGHSRLCNAQAASEPAIGRLLGLPATLGAAHSSLRLSFLLPQMACGPEALQD